MFLFIYIFIISFLLYLSYDIIPISNFGKITYPFHNNKYVILNYSHIIYKKNINSLIRIRVFCNTKVYLNLYVYDNITNIGVDNYIDEDTYTGNDGFFQLYYKNEVNKNYFFLFKNVWGYSLNVTFAIFSSETSTTISKIISSDIFYDNNQ